MMRGQGMGFIHKRRPMRFPPLENFIVTAIVLDDVTRIRYNSVMD